MYRPTACQLVPGAAAQAIGQRRHARRNQCHGHKCQDEDEHGHLDNLLIVENPRHRKLAPDSPETIAPQGFQNSVPKHEVTSLREKPPVRARKRSETADTISSHILAAEN